MTVRIATLNLKWKAFRSFLDFAPTDAELARGPFQLGEDHGAQVFSKMLSGDQGVPLDLLQMMAERINRQALGHRAMRSAPGPLGDLAITATDPVSYTHLDVYKRQPQTRHFGSSHGCVLLHLIKSRWNGNNGPSFPAIANFLRKVAKA